MLRRNAAAILQIDEEIQHTRGPESEARIRELRGRRNRLVPLGQLPPEILGRILYHTLWRDSRPAIYETVQVQDTYRHTWIESTLACRHVRAVAIQTPELWTVITDSLSANGARWAALCAERACACPLTIVSFVVRKQHAIRFLPDVIWTAAGAIEMRDVLRQQRNAGALDRPLPRLRHLQLSINAPLSPHFLAGSSASLTSLSLTFPLLYVPQVVAYPRLPALLHFAITIDTGATHPEEVLALMNLLAHTPRLQTLLIDYGIWVALGLSADIAPRIELPHLRMLSLAGVGSMLVAMVGILPKPSRSLAMECRVLSRRVPDEVLAYMLSFWMNVAPHSDLPGARVTFAGTFFSFRIGVPFQEVTTCPPHVYFASALDASMCFPLPCPIEHLHLDGPRCLFTMTTLGEDGAKIRRITIKGAQMMVALPRDLDMWVRQRAAGQNPLQEFVMIAACDSEVRDQALSWEAEGLVGRVVCEG